MKINPVTRVNPSIQITAAKSAVTATMKSPSRASALGFVTMGEIRQAAPITSSTLAIFEPITLPMERPTDPSDSA